jgi:hypothetical protein
VKTGISSAVAESATRGAARAVPDFPGYSATIDGRILGPDGVPVHLAREYPRVLIQRQGEPRHQRRRYYVHALVAAAFHGPRPPGCDIDHLDDNPGNPRPENLAYVPASHNRARSNLGRTPGGRHNAAKTHCVHGHPFDDANTYRFPAGSSRAGRRKCRACTKARRQNKRANDAITASRPDSQLSAGKPGNLCAGGYPITSAPCPECGATDCDPCGRLGPDERRQASAHGNSGPNP